MDDPQKLLESRVTILEARLEELELALMDLVQSKAKKRESESEFKVPSPKRIPKSYVVLQHNATSPQFDLMSRRISLRLGKDWYEIGNVELAAVVFVLAFAPGGRADVSKLATQYPQRRLKGARVIGIILRTGRDPVGWPKDVFPVSDFLSLYLEGTFEAIDDRDTFTINELKKLKNDYIMNETRPI